MARRLLLLMLVVQLREVRTQAENQLVFLPGVFQDVTISHNETVQAVASRIPGNVAFVTLQLHAQHRNATLSYNRTLARGNYLTAADAGLLSALDRNQVAPPWFLSSPDGPVVSATAVALLYSSTDPVPGACNRASNLEIDPNLYVRYNLYETIITFAQANLGYDRGATPPPCNASAEGSARWRLHYDVYQHFLPENDLSEESLFAGFRAVADAPGAVHNSQWVVTLLSSDESEVAFTSLPGQGVIFSVVVRDPLLNTSASYVPVHTYACSFDAAVDGCHTLGRVSTKVFFTVAGLAGLFICFFGHRYFKCELFCMGFGFSALLVFVLVTRTAQLDYNINLALSVVLGVLGGVSLVTCWWRFGSVMACVVVVGLALGFLVASSVLFTPLGDLSVLRHSDLLFWVTFCSVMAAVPLFFVRWPREGNIVACGVIGGYAAVLAVNAFVHTSLSYITLNVLKRLLNRHYSAAFTDVPFQAIDYALLTAWLALGVGGGLLQLYRERERPFFPPSPYLMWQQERERRRTNVLDPSHHFPSLLGRLLAGARRMTWRKEPAGEHTPLLL